MVHGLAPAPEAVVRALDGIGETGDQPLEGVRMDVDHARDGGAGEAGRRARVDTAFHVQDHAPVVEGQTHVAGPAFGQQHAPGVHLMDWGVGSR